MAKIICLFNHKGGVSKTTTAFNLGWMLASLGSRVILADFDPQCNLTGMVLGYQGIEDLQNSYNQDPPNNVKDALFPAFESKPKLLTGAECHEIVGRPGLLLLPGHIALAEYETTLGVAHELTGSLTALKNLPGSIRYMLDRTAEKYAADYILVDMSPSLSPINQNVLMTSDFFIVPLHPDYFSTMALNSLAASLPRWAKWAKTAHSLEILRDADYPFPELHTKFIGAIIQKYRPRNGKASAAFQRWIDELERGLETVLVPSLEKAGLVDVEQFTSRISSSPWEAILNVADFNSLIALSQEHQVPVYALTPEMTGQHGAVWDHTAESMEIFAQAFRSCAEKIILLTQ